MSGNNQNPGLRQILLFFIILYLLFLTIPAGLYGFMRLRQRSPATAATKQEAEQGASTSTPITPSAPPTPLPTPSAQSNAQADSNDASKLSEKGGEALVGFLDENRLSSILTANHDRAFRILDKSSGEVLTVEEADFLPAAVACEMPLSAPEEALKAQAVATYTYYIREKQLGGLENADFTCDTSKWLIYVTKEQMKERWGEDFDTLYAKIKGITDSVLGETMMYEGKPICAAYFAISAGNTESSANVWGGKLPYLQAVASPGDPLSNGYASTLTFTPEELQKLAETALPEASFDFSADKAQWFTDQQCSPSGYTQKITLCGVELKGTEARSMFAMPSTCFDVAFDGAQFVFTLRGKGHGVGMSQTGAMFMAENGSAYSEILAHYYPGATLVK